MVVGEHYNRLRNIYDTIDDLHIILTAIGIYVIITLGTSQLFQLVS
jgi:hypothetical protein